MTICFLINAAANIRVLLLISILVMVTPAMASNQNDYMLCRQTAFSISKPKPLTLQQRLQVFYPIENNAVYSVTVCADLPVNNNPACVFKKGEPGHVFLILYKHNLLTGEVVTRSFGFYPRLPVSCLFKKTRSKILDNSDPEYDASVEKELTPAEFELLLQKCMECSRKKYNLKKYNCYDYVLEVFNSIPGIEKLPVSYVKFPFIFGRGGSPCGLYRDLKNLVGTDSSWAPNIKFGEFKSPANDVSQNMMAFLNRTQ